jgi:deoxyadenosine/deoxycytidine kinase
MIFLKSSMETAMKRIRIRNRAGEAENISQEYIEKLENFY